VLRYFTLCRQATCCIAAAGLSDMGAVAGYRLARDQKDTMPALSPDTRTEPSALHVAATTASDFVFCLVGQSTLMAPAPDAAEVAAAVLLLPATEVLMGAVKVQGPTICKLQT